MSFRWFIYHCTLWGGCAAYIGWVMGRLPPISHHVVQAAVKAMFLGMVVAVCLTMVDTLWNLTGKEGLTITWRLLVSGLVGGGGGFTTNLPQVWAQQQKIVEGDKRKRTEVWIQIDELLADARQKLTDKHKTRF